MPVHQLSKAELRNKFRALRRGLDTPTRRQAAQAIARLISKLPDFGASQRFALYLPTDGEIDTTPLARVLRDAKKQLFLPCVGDERSLTFAQWREDGPMHNNRFGIPEPTGNKLCDTANLDVVCLPLVAWSRLGGRLGMGGGYYDRSLEGVHGPLRVGLGFKLQECSQLPVDGWDISLDFVVTEAGLIDCRH